MTTWAVVLLLLLGGLLIARLIFWAREPDPEAWWGDPVGWQMPGVEVHDWKAANRRAEALLAECLTAGGVPPTQLQALEKTGCLTVPSPRHPGRVYRIPYRSGLVTAYEDGRQVLRLCVQPRVRLPPADRILLHKLMIESDEERYLDTANRMCPSPLANGRE